MKASPSRVPKAFLNFDTNSKSGQQCCGDKELKSCVDASVNVELLNSKEDILLMGEEFVFSNRVEPNGYVYKTNKGDEAVITHNPRSGNTFGSLKTNDGRSFALEKCETVNVWKEFDVAKFKPDEFVSTNLPNRMLRSKHTSKDNTTQVTYSVMFYYTPEVAASTADIPGFIDQVLAETNQGYINSQIPITVTSFCIEQASINDIASPSTALSAFANMKSSLAELRNTADAAALIVNSFDACGIAYLATYNSGLTVSVTAKGCAVGYFSFGHELGHNFGAHHNPEVRKKKYASMNQ